MIRRSHACSCMVKGGAAGRGALRVGLLLVTLVISPAAAQQGVCLFAAQSLAQSFRCDRAPARQNASAAEVLTPCNTSAIAEATQPVLVVRLSSGRSDTYFTTALQRYNRTRPADAWPLKLIPAGTLSSGPPASVLPFDVLIGQTLQLGDSFGYWAPITGELMNSVSQGQVNDEWLATDATMQAQAIYYGVQRVAVLLSGPIAILFYRHDILRKAGVSPNMLNTWGGVLQAATLLHGTDWDGDGQTEYGFCFNRGLECSLTTLISMMGPFTQTRGSNQGTLLDAVTGDVLVNSTSSRLGVLLYQRLMKLAPPTETLACNTHNLMFLKGRCAMSWSFSPYDFKAYSQLNTSRVRGKFSVLPTPGSDVVLDRESNTLVPCDDLTCPLANLERRSPKLTDTTTPYVPFINYTQLLGPDVNLSAMLNIPPGRSLVSGPRLNRVVDYQHTTIGMINGNLTDQGQRQAMRLLAYLSSADAAWEAVLDPSSEIGPYRYTHCGNDDSPGALDRWLAAGYDPVALPSYLNTLSMLSDWGMNAVATIQVPYITQVLAGGLAVCARVNAGEPPDLMTDAFAAVFVNGVTRYYSSWAAFIRMYKLSLCYKDIPRQTIPSAPSQATLSDAVAAGSGVTLAAVLPGVLVPCGVLAGVALAVFLTHRTKSQRTLFGRILPPPVCPDLTFLIANTKDFGLFSHIFLPEIRDKVLEQHQQITNQLLNRHMGYQMPTSTPECLSAVFYCPADAANFALQLHNHMLTAKWPRELLETNAFGPVYMEPLEPAPEGAMDTPPPSAPDVSAVRPRKPGPASADPLDTLDSLANTSDSPVQVRRSAVSFHGLSGRLQGKAGGAPGVGATRSVQDTTFQDQCASAWRVVRPAAAPGSATLSSAYATVRGSMTDMSSRAGSVPARNGGGWETDSNLRDGGLSVTTTRTGNRSVNGRLASVLRLEHLHTPGLEAVLVSKGLQVCIGLCATCTSEVVRHKDPSTGRMVYSGQALDIAESTAAAGQGGMTLIPQWTFRQLPVEVMAQDTLFCHWGEYQFTPELMALDVYLALDKTRLGLLSMYRPLTLDRLGRTLSPGVLAAPVETAAMVFTNIVGVSTLLSWDFDLTTRALDTFTSLAQRQLRHYQGYLVEHVSGFLLSAFKEPGAAILWAMHLQDLMMREKWSDELLSHELCEEVLVGSSDTLHPPAADHSTGVQPIMLVHRGPRLKAGIDVGPILAALNSVTGRMAYRGKVMNRAARIAAVASSGQVLCSAEALMAAHGVAGINALKADLEGEQEPMSVDLPQEPGGVLLVLDPHPDASALPSGSSAAPDRGSDTSETAESLLQLTKQRVKRSMTFGFRRQGSMCKPPKAAVSTPPAGAQEEQRPALARCPTLRGNRGRQPPIQARSLGQFNLKGVLGSLEIYHCSYEQPELIVERGRHSTGARAQASRCRSARTTQTTEVVTSPTEDPAPADDMDDCWAGVRASGRLIIPSRSSATRVTRAATQSSRARRASWAHPHTPQPLFHADEPSGAPPALTSHLSLNAPGSHTARASSSAPLAEIPAPPRPRPVPAGAGRLSAQSECAQ